MVVIQDEEALVIVNKQHVLICGGGTGSNAEATDEAACE
jgi:uridylate kinase